MDMDMDLDLALALALALAFGLGLGRGQGLKGGIFTQGWSLGRRPLPCEALAWACLGLGWGLAEGAVRGVRGVWGVLGVKRGVLGVHGSLSTAGPYPRVRKSSLLCSGMLAQCSPFGTIVGIALRAGPPGLPAELRCMAKGG